MSGRFTVGAAVTVITLAGLAGCGGSSSSSSSATVSSSSSTTQSAEPVAQFKSDVAAVLGQFKGVSQSTGLEIQKASSKTDAQLGAAFQRLAQRWQAAANQLRALTPPAEVSAAVKTLKGEVANVEADLSAVATAAQTHDAAAAKQATTALVNDIVGAKQTSTTITNQLGIK